MTKRLYVAVGFLPWIAITATNVLAQATTTVPSVTSELDTYVKVIGAVLTGMATLVGLPLVFLTYRKTRAEISKLELEAKALRDQQEQGPRGRRAEDGNIRILVDRSPNTNISVLADPRFLAPLLILLDFIFAWVVITLAGYLLSMFAIGVLRTLALAILSALLLVPIARQVLRVRTVLRPPATPEEASATLRQAKVAGCSVYLIAAIASLAFGALLSSATNLTEAGIYLERALFTFGALLIVGIPFASRGFDRYLARLQRSDAR